MMLGKPRLTQPAVRGRLGLQCRDPARSDCLCRYVPSPAVLRGSNARRPALYRPIGASVDHTRSLPRCETP